MPYFTQLNQRNRARALGTDNADASNGVLFEAGRTPLQLSQQFLILGLGGSGSQTVNRIKGELNRQYSWERNQVAFLAIDTDRCELESLAHLDSTEKYFIQDAHGIENRHNIPANRSDFTKEWIHPRFCEHFDDNGSNHNRAICHAKMFDGIHGEYADWKLIQKIHQTAGCFTSARPVEVIIILGLSGGTGSGGLINIAHFVREALRNNDNFRVTGYFYLPDVFQYPQYTDTKKANGYAALKELDYYQCASQREQVDILKSHTPMPLRVDRFNPLYDMVFLVSGSDVGGVRIAPYNRAIDTVKKAVVCTLTEEQNAIVAVVAGGGIWPVFMMDAFHENSERERGNRLHSEFETDAMGNPTWKENLGFFGEDVYNYNAVGVGTASVPTELIKCYAVDQVMQNVLHLSGDAGSVAVAPTWADGPLSSTDGERAIENLLSFNPDRVRATIMGNVRFMFRPDFIITRQDVLSGVAEQKTRAVIYAVRDMVDRGEKQREFTVAIHEEIDRGYAQFELMLSQFVKEYGPFTFRDLYRGVGSDHPYGGLSMVLSSYLTAVNNMPPDRHVALEAARMELTKPIIGRIPSKLYTWIDAFMRNESAKMAYAIAQGIFGVGNYYDTHFLTKARTLCEECCEFAAVLEGLTDTYGNLARDFRDYSEYSTWLLRDHAVSGTYICLQSYGDYNWAKGQVDVQLAAIHYHHVRNNLVDAFMRNRRPWIEVEQYYNNEASPRKTFDAFIAPVVGFTREVNTVSFLQYKASTGVPLNQVAVDVVKGLIPRSDPMFEGHMHEYRNRIMQVPAHLFSGANGPQMKAAFENACRNAYPSIAMRESVDWDEITMVAQKGGLSIHDLRELEVWEAAYSCATGRIHRNESGRGDFDPAIGLEWKNYPNLTYRRNPRLPDATGEICAEGQFLLKEFDPLWEEAVKLGVIHERQDARGKYYYEYYNLIHRPMWNIGFDPATWPTDGLDTFVTGDGMFAYLASSNGKSLADITRPIRLWGQGVFSEPNPIRENALDWAKRSLRKNVPMYLEVKKTVAVVRKITSHIEALPGN